MERVLMNFNRYSDGDFESKTHTIIANMTGNAYFPTPVPTVADVTTAANDYSNALIEAKTGNRSAIAEKNSKRDELTGLLRIWANMVNYSANGDVVKLLTSGFDLSKESTPVIITKPENLSIENGISSGELKVSVNAVKGAVSYLHEYTTDETLAPGSWVSTASSSCKILFSNLVPGSKYYCRVGVVGRKGQMVYSDAVSRIVV